MKRLSLSLAVAALLFAACTDNDVLIDKRDRNLSNNGKIEFGEAFADNATRASKVSSTNGSGFVFGDVMGIYGFQYSPDPAQDPDVIFSNTAVSKVGDGIWNYEDTKYWNVGSTYKFYGIYPQTQAHTFDPATKTFTITNFVVADDKDAQVDIMIAKENVTSPVNSVDMIFNHLLSNVNFWFQVQNKFVNSGILSYELVQFDVTGISSKGNYVQASYDATSKAPEGAWTVDANSTYDFPAVNGGSIAKGEKLSLGDDLLLMPQDIADVAEVTITYKLNYKDGTTLTIGPKTFQLNQAFGTWQKSGTQEKVMKWEPNYRYNYYLSVNPSVKTDPNVDYNGGQNDYQNPEANLKTLDADDPLNPYNDPNSPYYKPNNTEDFYYIDVDNTDGEYNPNLDYPILWKDIDGDGKEEGIADKNRDGVLDGNDKFDDDTKNYKGENDDPTLNPYNLDVVMVDNNGDGIAETELERGGLPVGPDPGPQGNADWDGDIDGDDATGTLIPIDDDPDGDGRQDYVIDPDNDGEGPFYPVVWEDIDGDGKEEGGVDRDGDGHIDDVDGDGDPDPINRDTTEDGHGDTELERDPLPVIPNGTIVDWDGSNGGGDEVESGKLITPNPNNPTTWGVDTDGDGQIDYPIVWEDIDGDGMKEGGVDRDGDGHIDDVDQDGNHITVNPTNDPLHNDPSDATTDGENAGKDAIMIFVDTDNDGTPDTWQQLEIPSDPVVNPVYGNADYDGAINGYTNPQGNYVVQGDFAFIDVDRDGQYNPAKDYPILWVDLDGAVYTDDQGNKYITWEGVIDKNRDGKLDANDQVDGDQINWKGEPNNPVKNPYNLDVILLDMDKDHVAETPLVREIPLAPTDETAIVFTADVDEWIDTYDGEAVIYNDSNN